MTNHSYQGKTVWVIGATDGIGLAISKLFYSKKAHIILSSRSEDKLHQVNKIFNNSCSVVPFNVNDLSSLEKCTQLICNDFNPDYIFYTPAYYEPCSIENLTNSIIDQTIQTNITSVIYFLRSIFSYLNKRPICQLNMIGSVAGYFGLPYAQPYACTKAAFNNLIESFYAENPHMNIKLINPGFVKTKLTAKNNFDMPSIISPDEAAKMIINSITSNRFEIHFPKKLTLRMKLLKILPYALCFKIIASLKVRSPRK